jgi:hypothetical protein
MRKATIASIVYQSVQLAALIITGGVVGVGTYYALKKKCQSSPFLTKELLWERTTDPLAKDDTVFFKI